MEDNDIWLRIKAAKIAGQVFYGLGEEQKNIRFYLVDL